jgi:L-2,4-diaminobutyrate decarboxylase
VREASRLDAAFQQQAAYLIYEDARTAGPDLLGRQVECTKAPLGLKIFLNLAFRGERGLGGYVARQYDKTLGFWEMISAREGFECLCRPESNILCFRYGRDAALQVELRERLLAEGRFHLSSTEVDGERWLRLAVMAPATDEGTIAALLDAIERLASV